MCKTPISEPPEPTEFNDHFERAFKPLCVDYAFIKEYLSRDSLLDVEEPSFVHEAICNVFWTYRDSLYLGVAKLGDGTEGALSLQNYRTHHRKLDRWTKNCEFGLNAQFRAWERAFEKWMANTHRHTVTVYRHENLGHDLGENGSDKRRKKGPYLDKKGYISDNREALAACHQGILLLRWLTKLCGVPNGANPANLKIEQGQCRFKEAAIRDLERTIERCRKGHASLLDLI